MSPGYEKYRSRAGRAISVIVLTPLAEEPRLP